ncbi:MAG: hypothetical protein ACREP9_08545, partial [Candidatus Dormibacteraceae bacterium]
MLERCVAYALFAFVFIAMLLIEVLVHVFPPERLLPVIAVCLLGLLFIMFRLLIDLADKDKKKPTIFANLAAAYPSIQESIREAQKLSGGGQPTRVDIITSTAASAIAHLKDNVGDLKNVQFRIAILSPDNSPARAVSETWPAEINSSTQ